MQTLTREQALATADEQGFVTVLVDVSSTDFDSAHANPECDEFDLLHRIAFDFEPGFAEMVARTISDDGQVRTVEFTTAVADA